MQKKREKIETRIISFFFSIIIDCKLKNKYYSNIYLATTYYNLSVYRLMRPLGVSDGRSTW